MPDLIDEAVKAGLYYIEAKSNWYDRKNPKLRHRLKHLVIPPAWKNVKICPHPKGHLQAIGYDARGRKQYIYHPLWNQARSMSKFHRMIEFGKQLPLIRRSIDANLRKSGFGKDKVIAIILRLLEETHMRIGNKEYASENGTFGLTTLKNHHVHIKEGHLHFSFIGKSKKEWDLDIQDNRLAPLLKACKDHPREELFHYMDEQGKTHTISSSDINHYLHQLTGRDFSAKDFRTWHGTVEALKAYNECKPCASIAKLNRSVSKINKHIAQVLFNTPATCRKYYIHPEITQSYIDGTLCEAIKKCRRNFRAKPYGLSVAECATIYILKRKENAMTSLKQSSAAKRNIKKAARAAKKKQTLKHLPKSTRTALGKQAAKVRKQKHVS